MRREHLLSSRLGSYPDYIITGSEFYLGFVNKYNYLKICPVACLLHKVTFWNDEALLCLYRL